MALLMAAVYLCIELKGIFPKGSENRDLIKQWHFMLGLSVFFIVWLRLVLNVLMPTPKIVPSIPVWQAIPAKIMHIALYALMIALPLMGWIMLSASGKPSIPFFGLDLPPLVEGGNRALGQQMHHWHELLGQVGYWLIGLHAVAGLFHHYISRDNTLIRMLPEKKS
ncbi:UNVERIFIED_CONTAM: hypothetical protein GTU68_008613 [Idotea baltica]|nr:hypothetical protein [Idotea baltica]